MDLGREAYLAGAAVKERLGFSRWRLDCPTRVLALLRLRALSDLKSSRSDGMVPTIVTFLLVSYNDTNNYLH